MKEFFVGLLVLVVFLALSLVGILLLPVLVVMGFFLKTVIVMALLIFAVWLLGKVALMGMEWVKKRNP